MHKARASVHMISIEHEYDKLLFVLKPIHKSIRFVWNKQCSCCGLADARSNHSQSGDETELLGVCGRGFNI